MPAAVGLRVQIKEILWSVKYDIPNADDILVGNSNFEMFRIKVCDFRLFRTA